MRFSEMSPKYLQTMGIPLLRGQQFDNSIREDGPRVAIINETAARQIWPNEDPIGKRFKFFRDTEFTQVIGIARDSKYITLGEQATPHMYVPLVQNPNAAVTIFFRTQGDSRTVLKHGPAASTVPGPQFAHHECLAYRRSNFAVVVGLEFWRQPADSFRHDRHGSVRRRHLRSCRVFRRTAHPRIWNSHGAWARNHATC